VNSADFGANGKAIGMLSIVSEETTLAKGFKFRIAVMDRRNRHQHAAMLGKISYLALASTPENVQRPSVEVGIVDNCGKQY
jgi:hypothetical protein